MGNPLFSLGKITATPGALAVLEESGQKPETFLRRHARGDWGDCVEADKQENYLSIKESFRIISVYKIDDQKIWIITEADRSSTCILLPDEY
jgi:hypothetical protein